VPGVPVPDLRGAPVPEMPGALHPQGDDPEPYAFFPADVAAAFNCDGPQGPLFGAFDPEVN
jgi:hypothetical protein